MFNDYYRIPNPNSPRHSLLHIMKMSAIVTEPITFIVVEETAFEELNTTRTMNVKQIKDTFGVDLTKIIKNVSY